MPVDKEGAAITDDLLTKVPRGHLERRIPQLAREMRGFRTSRRRSSTRSFRASSLTSSRQRCDGQSSPSVSTGRQSGEAFLSDSRSSHTREAYARALDRLRKWLELHNLPAALGPLKQGSASGASPGLTIRKDGIWHTISKARRLHSGEPLSARTLGAFKAARIDPRRPFDPQTFPRGRAGS